MRRTQLLLPPDLHRRAAEAARARRLSLGSLVREALADCLARTGTARPVPEAVETVLLAPAFDDPDPDPHLSVDVDAYLYGAPRRSTAASAGRPSGSRVRLSGPSSSTPAPGWRCATGVTSITSGRAPSSGGSTPTTSGS